MPRAVVLLGWVSFFADVSSEMIFPLLPAFLPTRVAGAPVLLGVMEGLADLVSSGFKWLSGRWADRTGQLRAPVVCGYALSAVARPLMAWVSAWWQPLLIRSVDRVGKGVRTSPRDAMIASWVPPERRGAAFGLQRGMDHAGAALGSLAAIGLLAAGAQMETVFWLAAIPGAFSVVVASLVPKPVGREPVTAERALEPVPRRLWAFFVPAALFGLGNATDAFLLLKLSDAGAAPALLPLAWLLLSAVKSAVSFPAGRLADRLGTARVVWVGWTLYAAAYVSLAWVTTIHGTFVIIACYGIYHALAEGAERALLSTLVPSGALGRAFGAYHALTGLSSLAGGALFGLLWVGWGGQAAFLAAAALAFVAAVLLIPLLPRARGAPQGG